MQQELTVLYRGALETCNYACGYCPFAKRKETPEKKQQDILGLNNLIDWVINNPDIKFTLFFTPWGEALVFKRYQQALKQLSMLPHVHKIIVQTNLSSKLYFLEEIVPDKLRFWCTYHPSEVSREKFAKQTQYLEALKIKFSVGMVGQPELFDEIKALRACLNPAIYLWINAYIENNRPYPYTTKQTNFLAEIDPLFALNKPYVSRGFPCVAGETAITVDEFGDIRRCHFIKQRLGNIKERVAHKTTEKKLY